MNGKKTEAFEVQLVRDLLKQAKNYPALTNRLARIWRAVDDARTSWAEGAPLIVEMLRAEGLDVQLGAGGKSAKHGSGDGECKPDRISIEMLQEAVDAIPRDNYFVANRDNNIAMLHSIAGASGYSDEGREIWLKWDATGVINDPAKAEEYWDRLDPKEIRSGAGYIRQQLERLCLRELLERVKQDAAQYMFDDLSEDEKEAFEEASQRAEEATEKARRERERVDTYSRFLAALERLRAARSEAGRA